MEGIDGELAHLKMNRQGLIKKLYLQQTEE
ncbi:hypothetical protein RDI58_012987 [Solanum bulbocastanum]|uniref:Uncharacterized protein n=1 Tax=Solanum bulbocastanum TaxID=147425 RepID=A0AAN8TQS9_SOLBU